MKGWAEVLPKILRPSFCHMVSIFPSQGFKMKDHNKPVDRQNRLTIIELIVVIGTLGVLAAIVISIAPDYL